MMSSTPWAVASILRPVGLMLSVLLIGCGPETSPNRQAPLTSGAPTIAPSPDAEVSFSIRNEELREDILEQLQLSGVEHWLNDDGSIGHRAASTSQVDQIVFEARAVWITEQ